MNQLTIFSTVGVSLLALTMTCRAAATEPQPWVSWGKEENLALGKEVRYLRAPDRLANRGKEATKLTDGILSEVTDEGIWSGYQRQFSAWSTASKGVGLYVDTGSEQAIGKVAIRLTGGKPSGGVAFPSEITVVASQDGEKFYAVAKGSKVTEGERSLAEENPERFFHRPEEQGETYVDTFVYQVGRKARYIGFVLKCSGSLLAMDEIAIQRAPESAEVVELGLPGDNEVVMGGVTITPQSPDPEIVMTTNVITPNWFHITGVEAGSGAVRVRFTLPAGVELGVGAQLKAAREEGEENVWMVEGGLYRKGGNQILGPIFFSPAKESGSFPGEMEVSVVVEGHKESAIRRRFRAVEVPEVPRLKHLEVSLGWLRDAWVGEHPDFMRFYGHTGFNLYPLFPYYELRNDRVDRLKARAAEAREHGFKVLVVNSPMMYFRRENRNAPEIRNIVNGAPGRSICPSYTGPLYQDIIRRAKEWMMTVRPEVIFYDIEDYRKWSMEEAKRCSRCHEAFEASGLKSWDDFLLAQGTRIISDLKGAIAGTTPEGGTPVVGIYDVRPSPPRYDIFDFNQLYPELVQIGQPHLYLAGDLEKVHQRVRENYEATGKRLLVPWLTGGTFGEFPAYKMEQTVLECFLNGARGITYYRYDDMDPMDFYYHAQALKRLAPYEALLSNGRLLKVENDNARMRTSAFGDDRQALLLVGNYVGAAQTQTRLALPERTVAKVRDVVSGEELNAKALNQLEVPPGQHRLLELTFAE